MTMLMEMRMAMTEMRVKSRRATAMKVSRLHGCIVQTLRERRGTAQVDKIIIGIER